MNTMLGTVGGAMFSLDAAGQAAANGLAAAAGGLANLQSLVGRSNLDTLHRLNNVR